MAIKIDFVNARSEARKLQGISEQCGQIKNTVLREKDLLPEFWNGESGATAMELMQVWSDDLGEIESDLLGLSNLITRVAYEMEEEERQRTQRIESLKFFDNLSTATGKVIQAGTPVSVPKTSSAGSGNRTVNVVNDVVEDVMDMLSDFGKDITSRLKGWFK